MTRVKSKELAWVSFWNALSIPGFLIDSQDGNTYLIFAHDMTEAQDMYGYHLRAKKRSVTCVNCFGDQSTSEQLGIDAWCKESPRGQIIRCRPFWFYGRVYKTNKENIK